MALSNFLLKISIFTLCSWFLLIGTTSGHLSANFYVKTCPNFRSVITRAVNSAVSCEARMGTSLLRLHFHDCFVSGCDGSVLLDDAENFTREKAALQNSNSLRGNNVIDTIKTRLETLCPGVVSSVDILAAAAHDSVVALHGPSWDLLFGRRDSTTASQSDANSILLTPGESLSELISAFSKQGFTTNEMVALSGAHTIGQARCTVFRSRLYNDTNLNSSYATSLKSNCPSTGGENNLTPLDSSDTSFDNRYYVDLVSQKGLFHSGQELFNGGPTDAQVRTYSTDEAAFKTDFANAMGKMANLNVLTGTYGQVRTNCRRMN